MCGITGFILKGLKADSCLIDRMTETLFHRGPDSGAVYQVLTNDVLVALGHRRLAIIEPNATGNQPMTINHLTIVFNGEIYNYQEIRKELTTLKHTFSTGSDTEVLLKAFEEWGTNCLTKLIGMFAFAIHDSKTNKLYVFRDRVGVKPLYFYSDKQTFAFASELKAIKELTHIDFKLNTNAIQAYLNLGYVPSPHSIYEKCHKLKPGHYLEIDLSTFHITETCYWKPSEFYSGSKRNLNYDEAFIKTEELMKSAFAYRTISDVPFGVFLSSGYDSACLTAILSDLISPSKLNTYTVSVPDKNLDESLKASQIAAHLGTNHSTILCSDFKVSELINKIQFYYDEPFGDSSAIPTYMVCNSASDQVKVVLSADGGDELFAGYNRYSYLDKYLHPLKKIHPSVAKGAGAVMSRMSKSLFRADSTICYKASKYASLLTQPNYANLLWNLSTQISDITPVLLRNMNDNFGTVKVDFMRHALSHVSDLTGMLYMDLKTYLPDDILHKVDRASMANSIEAREPYLDHRLIEFVAGLPDEFKIRNGEKKFLLKAITHKYIPAEKLSHEKKGFAIPVGEWLRNDLKEMVYDYLSEDTLSRQKIFSPKAISHILNSFYKGNKQYTVLVWYLLIFQAWYRRWMN